MSLTARFQHSPLINTLCAALVSLFLHVGVLIFLSSHEWDKPEPIISSLAPIKVNFTAASAHRDQSNSHERSEESGKAETLKSRAADVPGEQPLSAEKLTIQKNESTSSIASSTGKHADNTLSALTDQTESLQANQAYQPVKKVNIDVQPNSALREPQMKAVTHEPIKSSHTALSAQAADTSFNKLKAPEVSADSYVPPLKLAVSDVLPTENHKTIDKPRYQLGSKDNPIPDYPTLARKKGWQGDVILGVHVAADGSIEHLTFVKSTDYGVLNYAAYETVRNHWRFDPLQLNLSDKEKHDLSAYIEVPISFRFN